MTDMSPDTIAILDAIPLDALLAYWRKRTTVLSDVPDSALLAEQTRRDATLTTVRAIADFCDRDPETIHRWARQDVDPLPHDYDARGKMTAKKSALAAWLGRHASKLRAKPAKGAVKPLAKAKRA